MPGRRLFSLDYFDKYFSKMMLPAADDDDDTPPLMMWCYAEPIADAGQMSLADDFSSMYWCQLMMMMIRRLRCFDCGCSDEMYANISLRCISMMMSFRRDVLSKYADDYVMSRWFRSRHWGRRWSRGNTRSRQLMPSWLMMMIICHFADDKISMPPIRAAGASRDADDSRPRLMMM